MVLLTIVSSPPSFVFLTPPSPPFDGGRIRWEEDFLGPDYFIFCQRVLLLPRLPFSRS